MCGTQYNNKSRARIKYVPKLLRCYSNGDDCIRPAKTERSFTALGRSSKRAKSSAIKQYFIHVVANLVFHISRQLMNKFAQTFPYTIL